MTRPRPRPILRMTDRRRPTPGSGVAPPAKLSPGIAPPSEVQSALTESGAQVVPFVPTDQHSPRASQRPQTASPRASQQPRQFAPDSNGASCLLVREDELARVEHRLAAIESQLATLLADRTHPRAERRSYTTTEVAAMVDRSEYQVREWCRLGQINATKRAEKRGGSARWSISSEELARYLDDGLMKADHYRNAG